MIMKYIVAVALVTPLLTASGMAQDTPRMTQHIYQGGPKSDSTHTTRQISSGGDIYAKGVKTKTPHAYRGGPKTVVPHGN